MQQPVPPVLHLGLLQISDASHHRAVRQRLNGTCILPHDLNLKLWEELIVDKKYDKVLQLLLYAWLFKKNSPGNTNISPGIYPLKQISKELLKVNTPESDSKCLSNADLDEFEYQLSQLLVQIFDPKIAFDQTTVLDTCKYCNYQILCNK